MKLKPAQVTIGSRQRVIIENVSPVVDGGRFPIKRIAGEVVKVEADIFADGHDVIEAVILHRQAGSKSWGEAPLVPVNNDRWSGEFHAGEVGNGAYTILAWADSFSTWRRDLKKRSDAGQDLTVEFQVGAQLISAAAKRAKGKSAKALAATAEALDNPKLGAPAKLNEAFAQETLELMRQYPDRSLGTTFAPELQITVERDRAGFSSWYEFFPRSWSAFPGKHGTFKDCERLLPEIKRMGFDVIYLPPIHPIGLAKRKGKNNALIAQPDDVGSPWAIGGADGGHTEIHPQLGTLKDFKQFVKQAEKYGIELALDIAFQCSPDHPWVKQHPAWFRWRPDGTVQFAENPPKKYEDILPINFETEDAENLWKGLRDVFLYWMKQGIRIFRVDNPHTKAFPFWEWLMKELLAVDPGVILLAEAFTRPKLMHRLAKAGYTQSYTYFSWRTHKAEIAEYVTELTRTSSREFFRPNFWPNTPDILTPQLQTGLRPMFMSRLALAATLSSNYGIYGPAYELLLHEAYPGKEEYIYSEKYELKSWDWDRPGNIKDFIARVNWARHKNPALQQTNDIDFIAIDNPELIAYIKWNPTRDNVVLTIVNLDPHHHQAGWLQIPWNQYGVDAKASFLVEDVLTGERYRWQGDRSFVLLKPEICPAHIFRVVRE